jgi:type IV pilus assembly protein PilB
MIHFDEEEQNKKLKGLYEHEEEDLAQTLAKKYGIGYADLSVVSINTDALRLIPEAKARDAQIAAFDLIGDKLKVAVFSPNNPKTKEVIADLERKHMPEIYMVSRKSLELAWSRYADLSFAEATKEGALDISQERIEEFMAETKTLEDVKARVTDVLSLEQGRKISQVVEVILAGAIALNASDVHLEPQEKDVRLRYRLDGILTDVITFRSDVYRFILSRVKLLSSLLLNVKNEAQDGRFSIHVGGSDIEIRTSIIPGEWAESVVLRLLNPESISVPMEELGIEPKLFDILNKEISRPNGLILNTGPTGSGKTTTLYAFLKKIHNPEIKIITIEDPIEYHLAGVVQTQVNDDYTFANGLRSALRQDPDVIMVGEIRDRETAEIAINASLTGHLVLSTLHTNNSAGTFPRLIDLGVNPKVLGPAMNVSMAQRLVRKLCKTCRKEIELSEKQKSIVEKIAAGIQDQTLLPTERKTYEPVGCSECNNLGFSGRIGIYEAILVNEGIEDVISGYASEGEIKKASRIQGIPTMLEDGIIKVLKGVTTLDEVNRVVDLESDSG